MALRVSDFQQQLSYLKIARWLLIAFLVSFPFQIRTLVFNMPFLPTGNFNEYASFFLYFGDVLLAGSFLSYGMAFFKHEVRRDFQWGFAPFTFGLLLMLVIFLSSIFLAEVPALSLWHMFRFVELFLLYLLLVNELLSRQEVLRFFLVGLFFQSALAMGQYLSQSSLGLRFLGEPILGSTIPGVAKIDLDGSTIMRAYGTFPHPNVFGGLLVAGLLWAYYLLRKNFWLLITVGVVFLMGLLFTFSRSAFLALGGGLLVFFSLSERRVKAKHLLLWGSIVFFLIVLFQLEGVIWERLFMGDDPDASGERIQYMLASKQMFLQHPFGVGLGHFTLHMQDYIALKLSPWLMQPVHSVYLLLLNEGGVLSFLFFVGFLLFLFFHLLSFSRGRDEDERLFTHLSMTLLAVIGIISLFDHYFLTMYAGQVFLFLYFGLASNSLSRGRLPRRKS